MSKITPTFLLISIALLAWVSAASISNYLADSLAREEQHKSISGQRGVKEQLEPEIRQLLSKAEAEPKNIGLQLETATKLLQEAEKAKNVGLVMDAVATLARVLEVDPKHPGALLQMASLSLQYGILDKALEYYPRYLEQAPNDLRANNEYVIALVYANQGQRAVEVAQGILDKDAEFFPAHLSLAIAYKISGEEELAVEQAKRAKEFAPNEEAKQKVSELLGAIGKKLEQPQEISPATELNRYFENHSIIGPKLVRINWPTNKIAEVFVRDFPVQQMPEFAKQSFIAKTKQAFANFPETITVNLLDSKSSEVLLSIDTSNQ